MTTNVNVLIDSRYWPESSSEGADWNEAELSQSEPYNCLGGSCAKPNTFLGTAERPTLATLNFTGTRVTVYGIVESTVLRELNNITFNSMIDNEVGTVQIENLTSPSDPPASQRVWYTSPLFDAGQHSVLLYQVPWKGLYVDYITLATGPDTNVSNQTVITDDSDSLVRYTGQWTNSTAQYLAATNNGQPWNFITPYGNGTHISNTIGDVVQFPFTGSSVRVYGMLRWNTTGSISLRFALDDLPIEEKVFPPAGASASKKSANYEIIVDTNYLFYSSPSLESGDHILQINVTDVQGDQVFDLDMFLYQSTFATPAMMPNVPIPAIRIQPPGPPPSDNGNSSKSNIGPLIGGIAGCACALLMILVCLYIGRRRRQREFIPSLDPFYVGPATHLQEAEPMPRGLFHTILSWSPLSGGALSIFRSEKNDGESQRPSEPQPPNQIVAANSARVQELERHLEELERENEILYERQADPPPYV